MHLHPLPIHLRGLLASVLLLLAPLGLAATGVRSERVEFPEGTDSAVVEGQIKGYEVVDYLVAATAGQRLQINLATPHGSTYFDILAPGKDKLAMFNGSTSKNQYADTLQSSGEYKVRVYMLSAAAKRNEVAQYRLEMAIAAGERPGATALGSSSVAAPPDTARLDAERDAPASDANRGD